MTEHTPGPWLVVNIKGINVLMVGAGQDGSNIVADIRLHRHAPAVEANARLIAASPDLLTALEALLDETQEALLSICTDNPNDRLNDQPVIKQARAAITRAKMEDSQ